MKNFVFIIMLHLMPDVMAQNLVPNGSFEDTVSCPFLYGQMNRATGWLTFRESPDYFNACNASNVGVPQNDFGFQNARTGNAYAGIITSSYLVTDYREHMAIWLSHLLTIGSSYYLEFYVSRGYYPGPGHLINASSNNMGARVATSSISPIDNYAQVYTNVMITDTSNWVKVSGFFVADSAYRFLVIGNFFDSTSTAFTRYDTTAIFSYYYVDDVLLTDSIPVGVEEMTLPQLEIHPNPADDRFSVTGGIFTGVTLYDVYGRRCFETLASDRRELEIDVRSFPRGLYFVQVSTPKGNVVRKLLVQ